MLKRENLIDRCLFDFPNIQTGRKDKKKFEMLLDILIKKKYSIINHLTIYYKIHGFRDGRFI